uniref:MYND-type domain-containing protein n=1 Tax=Echinostoma caproni TaxID=27848 RepID=A0A183B0C8_9TREM
LLVKGDEPSLCRSLSVKLRESGNDAWRNGEAKTALIAYNKALMAAVDDEQKSFVYANRALVLASLNMHSSALKDIERALQHNYPADRQPRLLARRAQYLLALGRVQEARDGFLAITQQFNNLTTASDALSKQIQTGLCKCEKLLKDKGTFTNSSDPALAAIKYFNTDQLITTVRPNQSPLYEVSYGGDAVGWQLIAAKEIRPGELITMDKPYARRLHLSCASSHCFQCFRRTINPVPCRRCAYAIFCSESCELASWKPAWSESVNGVHDSSVQDKPCHRFDCGQAPRLSLTDYAGWKFLHSKRGDRANSDSLKKYRTCLLSLPLADCIGGPEVASLAFTCVARTSPSTIQNLVQAFQIASAEEAPLTALPWRKCFPTKVTGQKLTSGAITMLVNNWLFT